MLQIKHEIRLQKSQKTPEETRQKTKKDFPKNSKDSANQ